MEKNSVKRGVDMNIEVPFYEEETFVIESDSMILMNSLINHIYATTDVSLGFSNESTGRKVSLVFHGNTVPETGCTISFTDNIRASDNVTHTGEYNKVIIVEFLNIGFNTWVECYRSEILL